MQTTTHAALAPMEASMSRRLTFALTGFLALIVMPLAATAQGTEEIRYYHTDAVGSVRLVTDANGQMVERYDYLPFGEPWTASPTGTETRRFGAKERDSETVFDYFGARYDASQTGRFTTVDPFGGYLLNPQTFNGYAYAGNNPLRFTDPTGLDFYLQCEGESDTCHEGRVGSYIKSRFEATIITSASLTDPKSGNTATVNERGVQISTSGKTYLGEFVPGTAAAFINGSGALSDFSFLINDNCSGTCLASGLFTFKGSNDLARSALDARGAFRSFVDREAPFIGRSLDELVFHPGTTQHRLGSGPSPHVSVPRDQLPRVPAIGPFHVDRDAPGLQHTLCATLGIGC